MRILLLDLIVFGLVVTVALLAPSHLSGGQRVTAPAMAAVPQPTRLAPAPIAIASLAPTPAPSPTPAPRGRTASGIATWFDAERGGQSSWYTRAGIEFYIAAGPALRALFGKPKGNFYRVNHAVRICSAKTGKCVRAQVVDWCGCHGRAKVDDDRLADLSPALFTALGVPLSRGVQAVTIKIIEKP